MRKQDAIPQLITFTIVKLTVQHPNYRLDITSQSLVSNLQGGTGVEEVIIGGDDHIKLVLWVFDHDGLIVSQH